MDSSLEGICFMEICPAKSKMVVYYTSCNTNRRTAGNIIYFCFQQKERIKKSKDRIIINKNMGITSWANLQIKKFNWVDIQLIKIAVFGFTLLLAKLWSPLLSMAWYWYALIFVLATMKLFLKVFRK
jgi:adenine specific DNA methylase Mod